MQSRLKTFLTLSLFCLLPLLIIGIVAVQFNLKFARDMLRSELQHERDRIAGEFETLRRTNERDLLDLASTSAFQTQLASQTQTTETNSSDADATAINSDLRNDIDRFLRYRKYYSSVALFGPAKRPIFVAEAPQSSTQTDTVFRTTNLIVDQVEPHEEVWSMKEPRVLCVLVRHAALGKSLRCTTPVFPAGSSATPGALVADLRLDSLISDMAVRPSVTEPHRAEIVTVLDDSGNIVYHTNDAMKHQPVNEALPYFQPIATAMIAGQDGSQLFRSSDDSQWMAVYGALMKPKLSIAISRNYGLATHAVHIWGWIGILSAALFGLIATFVLSTLYHQKTKSVDTLKAGVGAIAKGELDHRIDLRSSDDLRPVADNLGLLTKQLREQIAREAESRQFDSFARLSAVLTHDLKNAIEALSLTVSNMERHFDNADFRVDAMKTLRGATENLRSLVTRLSNPVTTLSGEHKRPIPSDLVPMLKRVISMTAAQADPRIQTRLELPESLYALVDMERMEKVAENLVINALEAMALKGGTLTIAAGKMDRGKIFFSVSDTGEGMSKTFIEERLFHPFATTKKRGVGLGLYTCREVVRANGGSIEVESERGTGTTFRVVLPSAALDRSGEIKHK